MAAPFERVAFNNCLEYVRITSSTPIAPCLIRSTSKCESDPKSLPVTGILAPFTGSPLVCSTLDDTSIIVGVYVPGHDNSVSTNKSPDKLLLDSHAGIIKASRLSREISVGDIGYCAHGQGVDDKPNEVLFLAAPLTSLVKLSYSAVGAPAANGWYVLRDCDKHESNYFFFEEFVTPPISTQKLQRFRQVGVNVKAVIKKLHEHLKAHKTTAIADVLSLPVTGTGFKDDSTHSQTFPETSLQGSQMQTQSNGSDHHRNWLQPSVATSNRMNIALEEFKLTKDPAYLEEYLILTENLAAGWDTPSHQTLVQQAAKRICFSQSTYTTSDAIDAARLFNDTWEGQPYCTKSQEPDHATKQFFSPEAIEQLALGVRNNEMDDLVVPPEMSRAFITIFCELFRTGDRTNRRALMQSAYRTASIVGTQPQPSFSNLPFQPKSDDNFQAAISVVSRFGEVLGQFVKTAKVTVGQLSNSTDVEPLTERFNKNEIFRSLGDEFDVDAFNRKSGLIQEYHITRVVAAVSPMLGYASTTLMLTGNLLKSMKERFEMKVREKNGKQEEDEPGSDEDTRSDTSVY